MKNIVKVFAGVGAIALGVFAVTKRKEIKAKAEDLKVKKFDGVKITDLTEEAISKLEEII